MRINTNIASLQAQRYLSNTTKALSRALERLSSGKRITRAGDDAAGLAISEGLQSQVRGLRQVARNINDAFGFLNTADGAIATQTDIVQRMRELAIQSANGTLGVQERANLDNEFQTLLQEFDRIAEQTQFNGVNLLDGSFGTQSIQVGTNKGETVGVSLASTRSLEIFSASYEVANESGGGTSGTGTFTMGTTQTVGASPYDVALADVNGDGKADLLTSYVGQTILQLGNGDGTFQSGTNLGFGGGFLEIEDLDGDGDLDIVSSSEFGSTVSIKLGNGDGSFSAGDTLNVGTNPRAFIYDINGDFIKDIVSINETTKTASIFTGDGDGSFTQTQTFAFSALSVSQPRDAAFADINEDGNVDILVGDTSGGAGVPVMLGNGDGTFTQDTNLTTGGWPVTVVTGDFNGDGHADVIVGNSHGGSNNLSVRLGTGTGSFTTGTTVQFTAAPTDMETRDLNGDGNLDLIVRFTSTNSASILLGSGSGTFTTDSTLATGPTIYFGEGFDSGDLNGDGVLDLAFVNRDSNSVTIQIANTVTIPGTDTISLDTSDLTITTAAEAQEVLYLLDAALDNLASARANIGAIQNRLEYSAANTSIMTENLAQARSQILDADIAEETAELTRAQILQQAGVSVLGQANTSMQLVLSLLGGLRR